ncbi:MAG TPA: hypothetical protein DCY48_04705 [Candidatus Magasanikbacteria bacterium]|nr:MAG: hypothetical protein A3I74_03195 [Candidatus Magasanikbacteria bacterium RIFCSPLOWO2_02_FULL_47_16]OGH80217.1 MAG: hypothetical protein A3C10_03475 [Candidatus Magasanikbacteria bacterium RIFCSPHIGHO2_02_FULL_48_18]OGH82710.1 MAG: hypothetical protein A3G08_01490 [Candidatus Magasanikbacteria bacterium RIFCSPLOWO2_12_FULL_47_9b]HAZ29042.1 hypothetical protein [Candidatus Magasanikbacteria bacterium]
MQKKMDDFFSFFMPQCIRFVLVGVLILFVTGCSLFQKQDPQKAGCEQTGGTFQDRGCACPELFPTFNETAFRCEDAFGGFPSSKLEADRMARRFAYAKDCIAAQGEVFVAPGTPITFCAPRAWGGMKKEDYPADKGFLARIIFPKPNVPSKKTDALPTIWYESDDALWQNALLQPVCFACFVPEQQNSKTIPAELGFAGNAVTGEVGAIDGHPTAIVRDQKTGVVTYAVPNAFPGYHLRIVVPNDDEGTQSFVKSVWFDDMAQ